MAMEGEHTLAARMGELAHQLQQQPDRQSTLLAMVEAAVRTVPGARWAGVSMVRGRKVTAEAPTAEVVRRLDERQTELNEGPCLTAIREHQTVQIDDLATMGQEWPRFAAEAVELGVRSVLAFQLFVHRENLGALNLYSPTPGAFGEDSIIIGHLFAQHAAVALADATDQMRLGEALRSRDIIGQAKGILMLRNDCTEQQAFDMLVQASQHANMKLIDVAHWLVTDIRGVGAAPRARTIAGTEMTDVAGR